MFDLFFLKYKKTFHKGSFKNITLCEYIILAILIVSSCVAIFQAFFKADPSVLGGAIIAILLDTVVMYFYEKIKRGKRIDERAQNYRNSVIDEIIVILKQSTYNLYSIDGINWLIQCCEKSIEPKQSAPLAPTLFPIFTLAYGIFLKDMPSNDVLSMTLVIIVLIAVFSLFNKYAFSYIRESFENPDKDIYKCLINELEYIKILFQNECNS